jgi:integrase
LVPNDFGAKRVKLTEKTIAGLKLPAGMDEQLVGDDELTGLSLRLRRGADGVAKSWVYRYMVGGARHKVTFAFAGHNLAAARKRAGDLQARIRLGHDPAQERAQTRADAQQTLEMAVRGYLPQKKLTLRPRSYTEVERHLLVQWKPLHRMPLRLIGVREVNGRYLALADTSGRTTATNSWRSLSAFFAWCMRQGLIERNPCLGVERFPDRKRDRVLSATEIKAVWNATAGSDDYSAIVRLLLLSGCRASEIAGLTWSEVLSDRIVLPADRVKNARQHTVPLTATMRAILDGRPRRPGKEHVFGRHLAGPFTGWGESKAALDARIEAAGVAMGRWTNHDLRRTLSTGMGELAIAPHVIETLLNHVSGFRHGVSGVYNRSQLEGPIRHALSVWDAHIREIVEGRTTGDRVVPFRA